MTRLCTFLPSRPASGLSLIPKVTEMVGGSMGWASSGSSTASAQIVSATVAFCMPARLTISPASASSMSCCERPRKARILVTRNCSIFWPMREIACTVLAHLEPPGFDAAGQDAAHEGIGAERCGQHAEIVVEPGLLTRGGGRG